MYKVVIDIRKDTPQEIKCKNCGSVDMVFWKDIYERSPHFWQCHTCGGLFRACGNFSVNNAKKGLL